MHEFLEVQGKTTRRNENKIDMQTGRPLDGQKNTKSPKHKVKDSLTDSHKEADRQTETANPLTKVEDS